MKVLIVNCVYDPEPIVSAQIGKALADELATRGHSVSVIAPFPSRPSGFQFTSKYVKGKINLEARRNLKVFRLPSFICPESSFFGRLRESISFGWHSYRYILNNSNEIDRVYMNTWPLFGQYGAAAACIKSKIPYFLHIQDVYPESLTNKLPIIVRGVIHFSLLQIEKYVVRNALRVIVISEKMGTHIAKTRNVTQNRIDNILNWQDESEFESYKDSWSSDKLTFMYLGNIGPVCGLPNVINSFIDSKIDAKLILAGNGSKKNECIEIVKMHPECDIEFWDVPVGDVAKVQAQAHVLILPLIKGAASSSIPSKLPAYMFSGRPIIATLDEDSDTANAIRAASCGWVGPAEDGMWLKRTFVEVSSMHSTSLQKIGQAGRMYALNFFSKKVSLEKMIQTILYG